MSRFNIKDILIPTAALVIICGICTALLAGTNELTKEPIASAEEMSLNRSMQSVAADSGVKFEKTDIDDPAAECYKVLDKDGNIVSYAVSVKTKGYGGKIKFICGIKNDGTMEAVKTLSHTETSGVGTKAVDNGSDYREGFFGKTREDCAKVDTITGATISSAAFKKAVDISFIAYDRVKEAER